MPNANEFHNAKKSLGQNFLVDDNICRKIVAAIAPDSDANVLEIGPGRGAISRFIAEAKPHRYIVLEKDEYLADHLAANNPEVRVILGDALKFAWEELDGTPWKIAGNLPYNIASKLIWDIVSRAVNVERAVFMVQHEVALRLSATHGSKTYGGLTAWVKNFMSVEYLFKVPPSVFKPAPKVDSAVVMFRPLPPSARPLEPELLSRLIHTLFQQRRKQLSTILKGYWSDEIVEWLDKMNIDSRIRPEGLSPKEIMELSLHVHFDA